MPVLQTPGRRIGLVQRVADLKDETDVLEQPPPPATMYTRLELLDLAEVIGRHDLWVFSDEVYHEITFGREHVSFASVNEEMAQRTITFDSASKTIALGGERIGALTSGNKAFIAEVIKNKTHATFSTGLAG